MTYMIKRSYCFFLIISLSISATALATPSAKTCSGKIVELLNWSDHKELSILIQGTRRYLRLSSESERAIALYAFDKQRPVTVRWRSTSPINVTDCLEDWPNYQVLDGFIAVRQTAIKK